MMTAVQCPRSKDALDAVRSLPHTVPARAGSIQASPSAILDYLTRFARLQPIGAGAIATMTSWSGKMA
jgi:hypothetical protein